MIKHIFIPEKIGSYYIFPQKIIAFNVNKTHLSIMQVKVSGKYNTVIEKYFEETIESANVSTYSERLTDAIKNVIKKVDKNFNKVRIALPAHMAIFKEMTLPFTDPHQIKIVLSSEIEPTLPFSIDEAAIDFVITSQNTKKKESTILAVVARKKDINDLIEPFENAGINPTDITVDIIGLFGLFKNLPEYQQMSDGSLFIDMQFSYSNIVYFQNKQLKMNRSINIGISNIAKSIADDLHIEPKKALDYLIRFGLEENENSDFVNTVNKTVLNYINNILFTINSFKNQIQGFTEIKKIFLFGECSEIKNFSNFIEKQLNIPTKLITATTLTKIKNLTIKEKHLTGDTVICLATAYLSKTNENFNLLGKEFSKSDYRLLSKQAVVTGGLIIFILSFLIGYSYLQISKLNTEINKSKTEVISRLKESFNITDQRILSNLSEIIQTASSKVNEEESIWFAFSRQTRFSFLRYLQELSSKIDREGIDLKLKKLTMNENEIILEGEVKDFKALEALQNELNDPKLFSHVTVPQETKFTIKLTIKKE